MLDTYVLIHIGNDDFSVYNQKFSHGTNYAIETSVNYLASCSPPIALAWFRYGTTMGPSAST